MFASFHSKGTTPSFNDKLNTLAIGILISSTVSISSFGGIPSTPGDLLSLKTLVILYFQHCLLEVRPCLYILFTPDVCKKSVAVIFYVTC